MSEEPKRCPRCGAAIPTEAPQGLCPKCLLAGAALPTEAGAAGGHRSAPPSVEQLAAAFPQLDIIELIGQGGMGFVYQARQSKLDRFVALKILPDSLAADPAFAERFAREGRLLARLSHPNIVSVHDFGQAGGFFYLLMEYVDGVNLRQATQTGRFTPAQALNIVPRICEALQYAHDEGVLHRDIKPENILLDVKGRVKIADFGIAKMIGLAKPDPALTATETALGTPQYMAPEQFERAVEVDHRADIYSLGVVFYELLTGELPVGRFAPPSEKTAVDARVDEIVMRALHKERNLRQQSATEFKTQVETVTSQPASPVPARIRVPEWGRLWMKWIGWGMVYLGIPVGILGFIMLIMVLQDPDWNPAPGEAFVSFSLWVGTVLLLIGGSVLIRTARRGQVTSAAASGGAINPWPRRIFWLIVAIIIVPFLLIGIWTLFDAPKRPPEQSRYEQQSADITELSDTSTASTIGDQDSPAASAELWSPSLRLGEKPNVDRIRDEAHDLAAQGRYEEALQRHIWYHHNALKYRASHSAVRLSFALSDWVELGRKYPKAKQALIEIRDQKTREFDEGKGHFELFQDVSAINEYLQNEEATHALFMKLHREDPALARDCYFVAEDLLVRKGDYDLCLAYTGDPQTKFQQIRRQWERLKEHERQNPGAPLHADKRFIDQTRQLIQILVGTARTTEAEEIRNRALALLDDTKLKSAVEDAEKDVRP